MASKDERKKFANEFLKLDELDAWRNEQLGDTTPEQTRDIVLDLLSGGNYRSTTEAYTKQEIIIVASWLFDVLRRAKSYFGSNWQDELYQIVLEYPKSSFAGYLMYWLVGFGKKTGDNVIGSKSKFPEYFERIQTVIQTTSETRHESFPHLKLTVETDGNDSTEFNDAELMLALMSAGAVMLSLRGSQKSFWGKRIGTSFLCTALSILGLEQGQDFEVNVAGEALGENWREMDARVKATDVPFIPIEFGLIGRGNPEITSDKDERIARYDGIVIVDNLSVDSRAYNNFRGTLIVLHENTNVLPELYAALNGRTTKPIKQPPSTKSELKQQVATIFRKHPEFFTIG
jgi:hypothetical protein